MSKKGAAESGKSTKSSKGGKPAAARAEAEKADCVASIINILFSHFDQHIKDKFIFPQIVARAVASTMAEVVNMVTVAHVRRMEDWLVHLEDSAPDEWDKPEEPLIPLIDSWARGVVPIKKSHSTCATAEQPSQSAQESTRPSRRASAMALSQYQDNTTRRRSSVASSKQGLRGSLRRFSDSLYPFDPNRKVKFQEKTVDDETVKVARRSSTPPPAEFFQAQTPDNTERRASLTKEEKSGGAKSKIMLPLKNKS